MDKKKVAQIIEKPRPGKTFKNNSIMENQGLNVLRSSKNKDLIFFNS
jgi:hypothetical protein